MKLSVIVPCYNEQGSIEEFYNEISKFLKKEKISYELIIIDDGSTDDTFKKIKELSVNKEVKAISFSRNFGKESAMLAGLNYAAGDYIAIMDADLQHTPDMLGLMYNKLLDNEEYDIVCAYKENRYDESKLKKILTSCFYRFNNLVSDVKLLPGASDFRVFKKCVKDAILLLPEKTRFLKGMFSWVGFNTIYVPYMPNERFSGITKWNLINLIKYSIGGIISFSNKLLRFLFVLSIPLFLIGLFNFILIGNLSHRTIILYLSFILLFFGVLSLYVARMYINILNRPSYIIKEMVGFNKTRAK